MAARDLPAQDVLLQLLRYDPETGKLFWKERPVSMFQPTNKNTAHSRCLQWNNRCAGKEAFTSVSYGYRCGNIHASGVRGVHMAHRVIWKMVYGFDPVEVDHINGDRADNRLGNLRSVESTTNGRNKAIPGNNTTGIIGVYRARRGKWRAAIQHDGRQVSLGYYDTREDAAEARRRGEQTYGYHPNHGRH